MADEQPLDAERIFAVLHRHGVDYVVIGGVAVQVHGHTRMTNDLDLVPAPAPANLTRLAAVLRDLGARVLDPGSQKLEVDARTLPRAALWQLSTQVGDIDLWHEAPGLAPYEELRSRALVIELGEHRIPVAGRDDLIRMKRASARPVDIEDIAALTEPEHAFRTDEHVIAQARA